MTKKNTKTTAEMLEQRRKAAAKRFKEKNEDQRKWMSKAMRGKLSQSDLDARKKLSGARDTIAKANDDLDVKIWQDEVKKKYGGGLT